MSHTRLEYPPPLKLRRVCQAQAAKDAKGVSVQEYLHRYLRHANVARISSRCYGIKYAQPFTGIQEGKLVVWPFVPALGGFACKFPQLRDAPKMIREHLCYQWP